MTTAEPALGEAVRAGDTVAVAVAVRLTTDGGGELEAVGETEGVGEAVGEADGGGGRGAMNRELAFWKKAVPLSDAAETL